MNKFIFVIVALFVFPGCATNNSSMNSVAGLKANYEHCLMNAGNNQFGQCDKEKDKLWQEQNGWTDLFSRGS